jgi:hypothetical protein
MQGSNPFGEPPVVRQHKVRDMLQFLLKDKKQKIHFLHIGKTGGSAIKSVLKDFMETPKYSLKIHGHNISLKDIPKGDSIVFFLRDPVSRFISGFYSRQRKGQPRYNSEWTHQEKEVFEHFSTPNEIAVSLANKQALAIMAMKNVKHFQRYDNWYIDFDYFGSRLDDILFVGFQEELDADFIKLKNILEIPQDINLPTDDVGAHKSSNNIDKSINESGISALEEWYLEDIKFISVCKELMNNKAFQRTTR